MAKLESPIKVYMGEIDELIEELKALQTYKFSEDDDQKLVYVDDVIEMLSSHLKTERQPTIESTRGAGLDEKTTLVTFPCNCDYCSNNPKNGGNGVCHCVLGTPTIY